MKIIEKTKKHDNIIMLIFIGIAVCAVAFWVKSEANDELWNFSNIYKMVNGYTIYKDTNVIITPLFFYIGEVFFKMLGANYLTGRILGALIFISMFFSIYQLFKVLNIRKLNSMLYVLGIMVAYQENIMSIGAYNQLAIIFYILGIIFLIKSKYKPTINSIIQGIIIFLIFLSKQNLAVYYIIANIICRIVTNKNKIQIVKHTIIELTTSFILLVLFLYTLYLNNNLYEFINYTVLGITDFADKNTVMPVVNIIAILLQVALLISYFIIAKIKKIPFEEKIRKNIKIMTIFSILIIFFAYPILNVFHINSEAILTIITTLYIIDNIIVETLLKSKKTDIIKKVAIVAMLIYFIIKGTNNNINYINMMDKEEGPYYGAIFLEETKQEINEIVEFIKTENSKGIDVKIVSYHANLYMNILKKNNGIMDLPFNGNMGKDGANGVINQIKSLQNSKVLITKEKDDTYQESTQIREYIQNNMELIGEISQFLIYK